MNEVTARQQENVLSLISLCLQGEVCDHIPVEPDVLDPGPGCQLPPGPGPAQGGVYRQLEPPLGQHLLPHQERTDITEVTEK